MVYVLWILGLLYVIACGILVLFVLVQEGKSGGLAGSETPGSAPSPLIDTFGAGKTQQGLFRATMVAAAIFFLLATSLTLLGNHRDRTGGNLDLPAEAPAAKTTTVPVGSEPAKADGTSAQSTAPVEVTVPPVPAKEAPAAPASEAPAPPAEEVPAPAAK